MVPLRLQLKNFLSYGEDAPVLDLEGIHVACLSGGNGQGKSALLDAMTWAVWGEARKSSEARKPDEELLRVGHRSMEVDFAFRVDATDYRVVRSYQVSASGKTSKPGLEFQVLDGETWQALTAESVRATQALIEGRVGIDYETFINSTFLLQGRSDEFTKKRPGERKEILGKILALGRYDQLAARAGDRWSRLRERATALEAEAARLDDALEHVGAWEADRDAAQAGVAEATAEVEAAAKAVADATATLSALDATAREAEALQRSLAEAANRLARLDTDDARVAAQIESADALIAQAETIEAAHAEYEALRARRAALDEKATLHRGVDDQRHALRLEIQQSRAAAEAEVTKLAGQVETLDRQIAADTEAIAGRAEAEAALARAETARAALDRLDAAAKERDTIAARIDALDKRLAADKGALEGRYASVVDEGKRLAGEVKDSAAPDLAALTAAVAEGEAAVARRLAIQTEGGEASRTVGALDGRLQSLAADRERIEARRRKLAESDEDACPTCGSDLSDAHRADVLAGYDAELAEIARQRAVAERERGEAVAARDALRAEFSALGPAIDAGEAAARTLASAADEATRRAAAESRLEALREEARQIKHQIDRETFSPDVRAERTGLADTLAAVAYDAPAHDAARSDAALRDHWAGRLRQLTVAAERLEGARADHKRRTVDLAAARAALDRGDAGAELKTRMAALDQQVEAIGYRADEHERVSRALDALADAPARLASLLDARRQRADLSERRAAIAADRRAIAERTAEQRTALDALQASLAARDAAVTARDAAAEARATAQSRLAAAQSRLGGLTERLDRAAKDRERRTATKAELRDVKKERALYGHLRRAFGKNGIPSLIIEETLPEIEARANTLLDRLSRGRTRVALETLKDKKTGGGTKETLDIRITDDQGVARPYETYSGGEAFRVNFALRIALSQMLAERSGTQIRTLVIDEGFGTQDAEGLQSLIGAIRAIQDDFETILVITHLDELKDAFPIRIEVRKEPVTGSTFDVIGA
ncbi:AAA family ATPase [Rubrivirga sp. IMCC45206]|uniref:AAA family ATPase n=1 Tax=Rubrivirga sp. IMCC45206 TaxID=3391614 RepID=UPI00398FFFC8